MLQKVIAVILVIVVSLFAIVTYLWVIKDAHETSKCLQLRLDHQTNPRMQPESAEQEMRCRDRGIEV